MYTRPLDYDATSYLSTQLSRYLGILDTKPWLRPSIPFGGKQTKHQGVPIGFWWVNAMHSFIIIREALILTLSIFVALQGCISWYSLATGMIFNDMISRYHNIQYTPCSLGSELGNTTLGTVFLDTLPRANIRNTSSRGTHWQCSRCRHLQVSKMSMYYWGFVEMRRLRRFFY